MAKFDIAIINVLKNEGGLNRDLGDGQKMTYRGLTVVSDADFFNQSSGYNSTIKVYLQNKIKAGAKEETVYPELENSVKQYYQKKYWKLCRGEEIQNQEIANMMLSFVVSSGGWLKPTLTAVNKATGKQITTYTQCIELFNKYPQPTYEQLYKERMSYLQSLKNWSMFGNSWTRMMNMFPKTIQFVKNNASALLLLGLGGIALGFFLNKN